MKYKVTEQQKQLISELRKRHGVKEQEFIMQAFSPTANESDERNTKPLSKPEQKD